MVRVFPCSFIRSLTCIAAKRTQKKYPAQYLFALEVIAKRDHPILSYLAGVFQKPEGWIVTPQVLADASGSRPVYIDSKVFILAPGNPRK